MEVSINKSKQGDHSHISLNPKGYAQFIDEEDIEQNPQNKVSQSNRQSFHSNSNGNPNNFNSNTFNK